MPEQKFTNWLDRLHSPRSMLTASARAPQRQFVLRNRTLFMNTNSAVGCAAPSISGRRQQQAIPAARGSLSTSRFTANFKVNDTVLRPGSEHFVCA